MTRKIYVLQAFTNGHEAALEFIKKQGWLESECEIIFCGTHHNVFKRLIEGRGYAVVPVYNSIIREVKKVTEELAKFREFGYDLHELDRLDLPINHCLLVPQHINRAEELERVMSKEEAIGQCSLYLDSIGITPDRRIKCDSTGEAARIVAGLGPKEKIGAIAPLKAAEEDPRLKVLIENIGDVPDNKTTFLLLENKAEIKSKVVGIIGINGRFGQMLNEFFENLGCKVIGSDKKHPTEFSNMQVVEQAEVIIFSVRAKDTPSTIRSILPYTRPGQLLMDVTSIKQPAVDAMLESESQVVGLHPMFRPEVSFDGQTIVVCPARTALPHWKTWVVNVLAKTGSTLKWSTPSEHDKYMIVVQVNPHLGNLVSALLIAEDGISVTESLEFTSPFYRIMFSLMGRLIGQNAGLYADIVMENLETVAMLERRIKIEQRMIEMIRAKDYDSFEKLFVQAREHFGPKVIKNANELFTRLIGVLNTLYGRNSIILEVAKKYDGPSLLQEILGVFSGRKINLAGINSVILGEKLQFTISLDQSRSSDGVRRALEELEKWEDPKVEIIN